MACIYPDAEVDDEPESIITAVHSRTVTPVVSLPQEIVMVWGMTLWNYAPKSRLRHTVFFVTLTSDIDNLEILEVGVSLNQCAKCFCLFYAGNNPERVRKHISVFFRRKRIVAVLTIA